MATDAKDIAAIHIAARQAAMPWLPKVHTLPGTVAFFRDHVLAEQQVWVAGSTAEPRGFVAFDDAMVHHLYVHPENQRQGLGTLLLDIAKESAAGRLDLWVFRQNLTARSFYERRGFRLIEETDGSRNEEGEPDARYRWIRLPPG